MVSPFSGVFIDRWERRRILVRVPLLRAVVAALLPVAAAIGTDSLSFYLVVLVVLSANRFFLSTLSAVLPQLVPEDDLLVANSVSSTGGSVANVLGFTVGAVLANLVGGTRAALLAAVAFAISAATARRVPVHRGLLPSRAPLLDEAKEVLAQMLEGLRAVRRDHRVAYGLSAIIAVQLLVGVISAVLAHAVLVTLGLEVGAVSVLLGVLGIGIGVGVVVVPWAGRWIRHDFLVVIGFVIAAAGVFSAAGGTVARSRLGVATFVIGISYAFAKIPVDTIVQEEMADALRGRAFAAYDMVFNIARVTGVGLTAIGYASSASTPGLIATVGVLYLAAAAAFTAWERWLRGVGYQPRTLELLQPGEYVTVRAYAGGRADEEPRALVVGGHELPIEQIDWRAVVEEGGRRARVFVVRVEGLRVRLAIREGDEFGWVVEKVTQLGRN